MTESTDAPLPRRDWLVLPFLALLSAGVTASVCEAAARMIWPSQIYDSCSIPDRLLSSRYRPNCRAQVKKPETPWLENSYNECGFRTAEPCGAKPPNDFRVAVLGLSIASGFMVPYPQTYAARTTALLERSCHLPVDFQNLAVPGSTLDTAPLHLDAALALHPDVVMMVLSAQDIEKLPDADPPSPADAPKRSRLDLLFRPFTYAMEKSRAVAVAQHVLYENPLAYMSTYLQHGDEAGYLRTPLSPSWQGRVLSFDREIAVIAARTQSQAIPFKIVFVPTRAQSILTHQPGNDAQLNPMLLGGALSKIAQQHGVGYLDLTRTFGNRTDAAELHYRVDMHPNSAGSAVIANALAPFLSADPKLAGCRQQAAVPQ